MKTFDLKAYLSERRATVEDALQAALPAPGTRPARLTEAVRYAVLVGGKRLRPVLCLAAAEAAGGAVADALPAAVAIELLHTYTLVHDDLPCMDNDLLRRGQPTVHAKYGEALGVLVGDALQALAFETLARTPPRRPDSVARLLGELGAAAGVGGVVGGQVEDIAAAGDGAADADAATIAFVHQHKTADLFRAALRMGALAVGAAEEAVERLGAFGNHLGMAFQIVDDVLDAPGRDGSDAARPPELSCLSVWSEAEARQAAAAETAAALAALADGLPGPGEPLAALARQMQQRAV